MKVLGGAFVTFEGFSFFSVIVVNPMLYAWQKLCSCLFFASADSSLISLVVQVLLAVKTFIHYFIRTGSYGLV